MKHTQLEDLRDQAIALLAKKGFVIQGKIEVDLDPDLPYMGYTTQRNGSPLIVVAGFALKSHMAINLLIHELSHVYRTQSGHPSHDQSLLLSIAGWVMRGNMTEHYQEKIIYSILNHVQDLYADDVSFTIFDKRADLNEFFMSWIHNPVVVKTPQDKWHNAEHLLGAAFAQGNLERHQVKDTDGKMQKAIAAFLKKCEPNVAEKYSFFKNFMIKLPEKVTEKEFEKMLIAYLAEFLKLTR